MLRYATRLLQCHNYLQYLFGDDLNKEMDDFSKASKLTRKVSPNQRVKPYRRPMGGPCVCLLTQVATKDGDQVALGLF